MEKKIILLLGLILVACTTQNECDKLNPTGKDDCYFELAKANGDFQFCDQIALKTLKESCYAEVGITHGDLKICNMTVGFAKDRCISEIAKLNGDEDTCSLIEEDYYWNNCYDHIAREKSNVHLCHNIWDDGMVDSCLLDVAKAKNNETICLDILGEGILNGCFKSIAIQKESVAICGFIQNRVWREGNCIKKLAELKNDSSICDSISILGIKEDCVDRLALLP